MKCYYIYKGQRFDNELALDDYLLTTGKLMSKYGDSVFSINMTLPQQTVAATLSEASLASEETDRIFNQWLTSGKVYYSPDGELLYDSKNPPRIGVTRFLREFRTESGDRLFPEFIETEYWSRRYPDWAKGKFTKAEEEVIIDHLLTNIGVNLEILPITDLQRLKDLENLMKEKWKQLALAGTAIHEVLEYYFKLDGDKYGFLQDNVTDYIKSKLTPSPYLTDSVIIDAIRIAKLIKSSLERKYGDDLLFYPEFSMISKTGDPEDDGKPQTLYGIIDLLVIDKTGKAHIVDYKTSVHNYDDFSHEKKLTYRYLVSTYQRMLEKNGVNIFGGDTYVVPLKLDDFKYENGSYSLGSVSCDTGLDKLNSTDHLSFTIWNNIDKFMPSNFEPFMKALDLGLTLNEYMGAWIPSYSVMKEYTVEQIRDRLEEQGALKKDKDGNFTYKIGNDVIVESDEIKFVKKVTEYEKRRPLQRLRLTREVKNALNEGILQQTSNVAFPSMYVTEEGKSVTWLLDTLQPYCNSRWRVIDNEALEAYGILTLYNKNTRVTDFVRVSNETLDWDPNKTLAKDNPLRKRKNLAGAFVSDLEELSKSGSLMADLNVGNAELIETMLAINTLTNSLGLLVGRILVVNPIKGNGVMMSNRQLAYCWKTFNDYHSVKDNKFGKEGSIKFLDVHEQAGLLFQDIMALADGSEYLGEYSKFKAFKSCKNVLDIVLLSDTEKEEKIKQLEKVKYLMESGTYGAEYLRTHTTLKELYLLDIYLYNTVVQAIMDLKGYYFKQQLKDHDSWIDNWNLFKGHSGSRIDNPGNLASETLNLVTSAVTEAYLNTRDVMVRELEKFDKLLNKFKKEKGFSKLNFFANQTALYSSMFREVISDSGTKDLLFVNPDTLQGAEKELLEYVLDKINHNRYNESDSTLKSWKEANDVRYYRVPLARGGADSKATVNGLMSAFKEKCKYLLPSYSYEKYREEMEGIFNSDSDSIQLLGSEALYEMTNMFDVGENNDSRETWLNKKDGMSLVERNLETLLYKHIFAYSVKESIDLVFPLIKASVIHLKLLGAFQNKVFEQDVSYMEDYIRSKILNKSLAKSKNEEKILKVGLLMQKSASFMALAFSPVQMIYLPLQGLWLDISLCIRLPNGDTSFTFNNFASAIKMLWNDLTNFSGKPTIMESLNKLYGINDMDMNTYVDKFCNAKSGFWNFSNLAYKFASRPDFYNRMAIIGAKMIGDGVMKAHSINNNGELEYDWTKDDRFSVFAKSLKDLSYKNDPKYIELRALYYAVATQFEKEHTKYLNGDGFKLNMKDPQALPRAYTNKEMEGMKSLTDDIYGYYSHEKKSLVMASTLGSMWLLFKTYWSGKKNQWALTGAVRMRGKWEQYQEYAKEADGSYKKDIDGNRIVKKYYYLVEKDGTVNYDKAPVADDGTFTELQKAAPFMLWKGQWQEGIIVTLADIIKDPLHAKSTWSSKWEEPDDNLRNAYRNNLHQLWYDISMFIIGGVCISGLLKDWLKDLLDPKNTDILEGAELAALSVLVKSVSNSFMDCNPISSVFDPLISWTPFVLNWGAKNIKNLRNVISGDLDAWDAVVNSWAITNLTKPFFDAIKPEMFRTEREGGTFGL